MKYAGAHENDVTAHHGHRLDASAATLQDEDPADNLAELVTFTRGLARNLKNVGAAAPAELKAGISEELGGVWLSRGRCTRSLSCRPLYVI